MPKESMRPVVFSALEVANICGVVNQTAINWIRNNHLKAFSTPGGQYRVYADDLAEFMSSRGMRIPGSLMNDAGLAGTDMKSILIVDDDRGLNAVIAKYLGKTFPEFSIYQSFDGFDAGSKIAENRPGFIILDLDLPGINGESVLRRLKENESFGKPHVIVITALDDEEIRSSLMEMGADMLFKKPLTLKDLSDSITELLGK
ncbi:MAG: response regulator [Spirochaetaceae bacterium]|jgi:excisionase family DNA binding protein|nr:response regulator [Spirochaetaceae bacterium]